MVLDIVCELPGPHLAQRAEHETDQHGDGDVVELLQQIAQQPDESGDSDENAEHEEQQRAEVAADVHAAFQLVHRIQHEVVFAHQQQDEAAGDAGQDHRADCDGSAQDQVEW